MVKVIVFGLDGGTWNLLKPMIKRGELSTFKKLIKEGAWGKLKSTYPPVTMPAWPAMLMSKKPEKLNIYEFLRRSDKNYGISINKVDYSGAIWKILKIHDKKSYIINIPLTQLPNDEDFEGIFIIGPILNFGKITNSLRIKKLIKKYRYLIDTPLYEKKSEKNYIRKIISRSRNQIKLVKDLLNEDWDLFFYVNYFTDTISHYFWKNIDSKYPYHIEDKEIVSLIKSFYKIIDEFLSFLIGKGDYVFIVSDHGFGPLFYEVNLNKWLASEGLLRYHKVPTTSVLNKSYNNLLLRLKSFFSYEILSRFHKMISNILKLYTRRTIYFENKDHYLKNIDYKKSKAYSMHYGGININLKGREPYGMVEDVDFDFLRQKIIKNITKLRDPEGRLIIKKAWKVEELYNNPDPRIFPDIVLQFKNFNYLNRVTLTKNDKIFEKKSFSGCHEQDGIIIAYGKGIKKNFEVNGAEIYDLLPTLLHILSIPIPNDIDGRALLDIFDGENKFINKQLDKFSSSSAKKEELKKIIQNAIRKDGRI
jgi:predicted AlkP superfamily phosphohydrolase/phosphomutase